MIYGLAVLNNKKDNIAFLGEINENILEDETFLAKVTIEPLSDQYKLILIEKEDKDETY